MEIGYKHTCLALLLSFNDAPYIVPVMVIETKASVHTPALTLFRTDSTACGEGYDSDGGGGGD